MLCQPPLTRLRSPQDCKRLYQFLDFCQQKSIETHHPKIASITLEIAAIDPLAVLDKLSGADQLHFYIENRDQGWAIAAVDAAISHQANGPERFSTAQRFVESCLKNLIFSGAASAAWATPRFFGSFTFFDQPIAPDSPFSPALVFLPRWQMVRHHDQSVAISNWVIDSQVNIEELTQTIWQQLKAIALAQPNSFSFSPRFPSLLNSWKIIDTHNFPATVTAALDAIAHRQFDKLVLAHAIDVVSPLPFQWGHSLDNLRQLYPDCYVFSTGNGNGQSFIGASPERVLSVQHHQLTTDALAGSAPRGKTFSEDVELAQQLLSSDKERREHQVVVDFITQQLTRFGLTPRLPQSPDLLRLSNIQHLHTPIQAALPADLHPLTILAALHPTPAVAGMPRGIACQQIRRYESFERSLYAAPLGWIDTQGNAEFIVGIRSALVEGDRARLYAGAGIVAGSDPQRELAEIRLKLQALLRALV